MPYVSGGYAATSLTNTTFDAAGLASEGFKQDRSGWYAGVGLDYAITPSWIIGGEYRHYDFGTARGIPLVAGATTLVTADTVDTSLKADTVTVRLSYKFWAGGPVVARY
jgi:outer membrane immunogenic protein